MNAILSDFGLKPRKYNIELLEEIYSIAEEDKSLFERLSEKYGMKSYKVNKYPDWLVAKWRGYSYDYTRWISAEIEFANNIYMTDECLHEEYAERRLHWTKAIGYCHCLKDLLREIYDCTGNRLGEYAEISALIDKEVLLLKGLRKSDNGIYKKKLKELNAR